MINMLREFEWLGLCCFMRMRRDRGQAAMYGTYNRVFVSIRKATVDSKRRAVDGTVVSFRDSGLFRTIGVDVYCSGCGRNALLSTALFCHPINRMTSKTPHQGATVGDKAELARTVSYVVAQSAVAFVFSQQKLLNLVSINQISHSIIETCSTLAKSN